MQQILFKRSAGMASGQKRTQELEYVPTSPQVNEWINNTVLVLRVTTNKHATYVLKASLLLPKISGGLRDYA